MIMRFSVPIASVSRKIQATGETGLALIRLILRVVFSAVTYCLAYSLLGLNDEDKKWKLPGPRVHVNILLKPYRISFIP
jgi:hypothetical protein